MHGYEDVHAHGYEDVHAHAHGYEDVHVHAHGYVDGDDTPHEKNRRRVLSARRLLTLRAPNSPTSWHNRCRHGLRRAWLHRHRRPRLRIRSPPRIRRRRLPI